MGRQEYIAQGELVYLATLVGRLSSTSSCSAACGNRYLQEIRRKIQRRWTSVLPGDVRENLVRVAGVRVRAHCFSTCQGMFVCTLIAWKIVAAKINALPLIVYRCHGFIAHTKKLLLERSGKPPAQHSLQNVTIILLLNLMLLLFLMMSRVHQNIYY